VRKYGSDDVLVFEYMKYQFAACEKLGLPYLQTREGIASDIGISIKTVSRIISRLIERGAISRERESSNIGGIPIYVVYILTEKGAVNESNIE
jgi:DNA-binding MarR family transcriptional regulator